MTAETAGEASPGEASFQLLAEHLPDLIIFAFDAHLRMWAATGGGLRARGWTSEEFIGMTCPRSPGRPGPRTSGPAARPPWPASGRSSRWPATIPRTGCGRSTSCPSMAAAPRGGMVLCRDVTEQRRAEERLQASQRQLAEAQRIAQVGSWEWDLETDELTVSDELCRLFGLPVGIKLTMTEGVAATIHPADQERVATSWGGSATTPRGSSSSTGSSAATATSARSWPMARGWSTRTGGWCGSSAPTRTSPSAAGPSAERRRLLHRVYEAQEGQDRRLAADLHDGHVQSLAAIGFKLEQARLRLGASGSPEVDELLWQVTKDLSAEVTSLRRTIGRLRPLVLVEDGLEAALREEAKSACNRAALVSCEVTSELDGRLDPVVETALFRVAQQALANVVDHAGATHALVAIECSARA